MDEHYRNQYTCRYEPVLQMFAVLHLSDVVARFFPGGVDGGGKDGPEALQFGLEALMQSRIGFPIANTLQEMLRRTAHQCSIRLPRHQVELMAPLRSPKQTFRIDDFIDACTRPSYSQPVVEIHQRYLPSFSAEWITDSISFGFSRQLSGPGGLRVPSAEERGAQSLMQIRNVLNTN